jgi:hypothetical protein
MPQMPVRIRPGAPPVIDLMRKSVKSSQPRGYYPEGIKLYTANWFEQVLTHKTERFDALRLVRRIGPAFRWFWHFKSLPNR